MDEKNNMLLKSEGVIWRMVLEKGATADKMIICSCGTGRETTTEFIFIKWLLKYPNVRIYEGLCTEWTSYRNNPTVVGKEPKKLF